MPIFPTLPSPYDSPLHIFPSFYPFPSFLSSPTSSSPFSLISLYSLPPSCHCHPRWVSFLPFSVIFPLSSSFLTLPLSLCFLHSLFFLLPPSLPLFFTPPKDESKIFLFFFLLRLFSHKLTKTDQSLLWSVGQRYKPVQNQIPLTCQFLASIWAHNRRHPTNAHPYSLRSLHQWAKIYFIIFIKRKKKYEDFFTGRSGSRLVENAFPIREVNGFCVGNLRLQNKTLFTN